MADEIKVKQYINKIQVISSNLEVRGKNYDDQKYKLGRDSNLQNSVDEKKATNVEQSKELPYFFHS